MSGVSIIKDKDASSIWSGYIFQGEVAICRALEKINELIDVEVDIPETYILKIEEEEDFSIVTDSLLIFQVKAYTSHNYVKYAEAWRSLMTRYPDNSKHNFLILHKGNLYYNSCEFESSDFPQKDLMESNIIAGEYTLDNVRAKVLEQINILCTKKGLSVDEPNIEHKYYNCCSKINTLIRARHKSKVIEQIILTDIVDWVADNSIVVTEELAWYKAERRLINTLIGIASSLDYAEALESEKLELWKVNEAINKIEDLSTEEMKCLLKDNLSPHHTIDVKDLNSFDGFIHDEAVRSVIGKALRKIQTEIDANYLRYNIMADGINISYQLTTHNAKYDITDRPDFQYLQKECEKIIESPICKDVDYFVTGDLDISKEDVEKRLINQSKSPQEESEEGGDKKFKHINDVSFGFISVENSIVDINKNVIER